MHRGHLQPVLHADLPGADGGVHQEEQHPVEPDVRQRERLDPDRHPALQPVRRRQLRHAGAQHRRPDDGLAVDGRQGGQAGRRLHQPLDPGGDGRDPEHDVLAQAERESASETPPSLGRKKNNITSPVVGLLGNLSDPQGNKRTDWAWNTIKASVPERELAGSVQAYLERSGRRDRGREPARGPSGHQHHDLLRDDRRRRGDHVLHARWEDRSQQVLPRVHRCRGRDAEDDRRRQLDHAGELRFVLRLQRDAA